MDHIITFYGPGRLELGDFVCGRRVIAIDRVAGTFVCEPRAL